MENPHQYLLSDKKRRDLFYLIRITKPELEKAETTHEMISKYHQKLWYKRIMQMSKYDLEAKYYQLAKQIESYETTIADCRRDLHLHNCAVEALHYSMKPYEGLDFNKHQLTQQQLF